MVFFTCGACGESLKKAQVEKHVTLCRGCEVLSCIDCGKDFWGDDYKDHVRCISEDQKYGGKGYEAKANKGDVKQQQWLQKVQVALNKPGICARLKSVLQQVATYDNVPRKQAKFQNWMKNSLKISNPSLHEQVWNILSAEPEPEKPAEAEPVDKIPEKKKLNKQERKEARRKQNGAKASKKTRTKTKTRTRTRNQDQDQDQELRKKERKRKHRHDELNGAEIKKTKIEDSTAENDQEPDDEAEKETQSKEKFNWKGNIKALLRESEDQELPLKKLRKRVVAAYYSFTGDSNYKSKEEVLAVFNQKLHKNPKFRILKDRVKLVK
ncbi:LOW QUALITY PROTEIN: cell growth-regulating nucleolar protein [Boleophthalmus pectinirostris]|uniref:LOW QUALITY PROTEIN: cell growth-regulating nucleolar protein n=1 Tax=Boleophthalmus pectinirostris TaxID=150288 RepID=UPI00242B1771|nr:LOW QUALITY PROTEIN: cell growth-regulating nucleolar protein [Boleophthalmus pectinirostris]